jgi:hypothetical protein
LHWPARHGCPAYTNHIAVSERSVEFLKPVWLRGRIIIKESD